MSTTTYDYFLSGSFPNGLSEALLARQITDAALGPDLLSVSRNGDDVAIKFDAALPHKALLDGIVAAHDPRGYSFDKNFLREEYVNGRLSTVTWYAAKDGDDFLYKVEETTYTYDDAGAFLMYEQVKLYNSGGAVTSTRTWQYVVVYENAATFVHKVEV